jgi:hypothetical protein
MSGWRKAAVVAGLFLAIATLLFPLFWFPLSPRTRLGREIMNFTHVPIFAVASLLLLHLSGVLARKLLPRRWQHYAVAAGVAGAAAVGTEVFQYFGSRDADVGDLARNLAGVVVGLAVLASRDRGLAADGLRLRLPGGRTWFAAAVTAALVFAVAPIAVTLWAYSERAAALPLLRGFDALWERPFLHTTNAAVDLVPPPPGWDRAPGERVARVTFSKVAWPSIALEECYPNWTGYSVLALDLYSASPQAQRLWLSVEDIDFAPNDDRFNHYFELQPGATRLRIPISDVRVGPVARELDLTRVRHVRLIAVRPAERFVIWIDDLRLEGEADQKSSHTPSDTERSSAVKNSPNSERPS